MQDLDEYLVANLSTMLSNTLLLFLILKKIISNNQTYSEHVIDPIMNMHQLNQIQST